MVTFNLFSPGGLPDQISSLMLVNSITPILNILLDTRVYIRLFKISQLKKSLREGKAQHYTQWMANEIVKGLDFKLSEYYAFVFNTIAVSLFYATIFPAGILIAIMTLVMAFWAYKVWMCVYIVYPR